jgi:hypothetical protein
MTDDPFTTLGLPTDPSLTTEQVRTAWRAIATTTHPDRPDGGDPATYATASAAYTLLRTPWGRSEAYADLTAHHIPHPGPPSTPITHPATTPHTHLLHTARWLPARIRHGRPARLTLRLLATAILATITTVSGAGAPAVAGVLTGIATWLVLSARGDLAPPPGR